MKRRKSYEISMNSKNLMLMKKKNQLKKSLQKQKTELQFQSFH